MPDFLKVLAPGTAASPRRGLLSALATVGVGSILGRLGAPSAEAKKKGKKNKNKSKDNKKDSCPECSSICHSKFTLAGGHTTCGNFPITNCAPCTSIDDCVETDSDFPYCVTEVENLNTGEKVPATCGVSPPGVCLKVHACIPLPPLSA